MKFKKGDFVRLKSHKIDPTFSSVGPSDIGEVTDVFQDDGGFWKIEIDFDNAKRTSGCWYPNDLELFVPLSN